ncbi:fatty-acid amide hydrolase 2-A-like [Parasteatoda tepidariorum]|uniref:fatty-acid amide hydrolase 2-A-like n=1 Tax=Parasteatoda tepidariorum TaxID=114398 RepID=UPI001C71EB4E|nr:fatty-acid amide hydrolase 2-A-like [Parasteatoda tepidariorum]
MIKSINEKIKEFFQERNQGFKNSKEDEEWSFAAYWFLRILHQTGCFLWYVIVSMGHWGKGKPIPSIKNDLLLLSATKIAEEIRNGKITSEEVVKAYIERINEVNPYINAVAENRFEKAVKEAKECDYLVKSGFYTREWLEKQKPLLGVPVTIKVLFKVKGCHSTAASTLFKDLIATEDAPAVELLKSSGAIILATTNSAESGLGLDTTNILYGKTLNPYDCNRTPGGSSGGESALISSAGSVIGLGNDLLGSVRIPACFTGLFAHKPSRGLVPNQGCFPTATEGVSPYLASGPLCRYAEDLATMMEVLTSKNDKRMKFNKPVDFKKMKIYYQTKVYHPLVETLDKEILNYIMTAISHFIKNYGVVAKEVDIKMDLAPNMFQHILTKITEPVSYSTSGKMSEVNLPLELLKLPFGKSNFSFWTLFTFVFSRNPLIYKEENIPFYIEYQSELYKKFDSMLDENSIFICPTLLFTAPRPYQMMMYFYSIVWAAIFSFLGFPATQVPMGLTQSGLPHGMQIVTAMNNDNLSLVCAKELSEVFGGWTAPS